MAFPPAHFLIGAGLAEVVRASLPHPPPRWTAWAVGGCVAALPDVDIVLGILTGAGTAYHGTFTHSFAAVLVWALVGYVIGGGRWAAIVGLGYASHLLVDLMDDSGPTNLMLWWPFSTDQAYSLGSFFPKVLLEGVGMRGMLVMLMRPEPMWDLLRQTALAAACSAALLLLAAAIRRVRERRAEPAV